MHYSFLALDDRSGNYDTARFAVLPVPYETTTTFQTGTRNGPMAILAASEHLEEFDEELMVEPHRYGIATVAPVKIDASGPEAMQEIMFSRAKKVVRDGKFLIGLGGEHSITPALVRAVASKYKPLSILQIDAHLDLRDSYDGSPYSHACAMRRCMEYVDCIVPVGIRNVAREEHRFIKDVGIDPIYARQCREDPNWMDRVLDTLGDTVYLTVDIDGLDPSIAPGTGTPEPGGLDWWQASDLIVRVAREKNLVAADVVEVMPIPGQQVTEFLSARLIHRLMSAIIVNDRKRRR